MPEEDLFEDVQQGQEQSGEVEEVVEYGSNNLSTKPIGEKYERVDLDGQVVVLKNVRLLGASKNDPIEVGLSKKSRYKKCGFTVYYDTPNDDREILNGVIQFLRDDGTLSEPTIYIGGKNQSAILFKKVASKLNKKPEELSMKEFIQFLKTKPKVKLVGTDFEWQEKITRKNIIGEFVN